MPLLDEQEPSQDDLEKHERRITRCASCRAQIIWFKTPAGQSMPVDALTVEVGDTVLDLKRHESHFASCPNADKHRKPRK